MGSGRPKESVEKDAAKAASRSRTSRTKINVDAKPGRIKQKDKKNFECTCCGKVYTTQKNNFPKTYSPLFAANDGRLTVCKTCFSTYYEQLVEFFGGNEEKAIVRMAQIADWYYHDKILAMTERTSSDASRALMYGSKIHLTFVKKMGTTYLDTVKDQANAYIDSFEDLSEKQERDEVGITKAQFARWGPGFEESEYRFLDDHYKSLKETIDTNDVVQDTLAKDLCEIKLQQLRARNRNDVESFQRLTKLYQDTLRTANIKVKKTDADTANDNQACWGVFIRNVEQYTPADIYQDKSLFADVDGIKEYLERFVLRPVKNFLLGTRVMDKEFSISAGDDTLPESGGGGP